MRLAKRKWGYYVTLIDRKHFKVKLLWFKRLKACSLQRHKLRNELWLFLFGKGTMQLNGSYPVYRNRQAGEFIKVNRNNWHQFVALASTLVMEIQYGEKCIEEDIVRHDI